MKNIFIILLILISISCFAAEVTDGGILSETPNKNITVKALTDLKCPALNGQVFGNYLYKGGEITIRSNKPALTPLTKIFQVTAGKTELSISTAPAETTWLSIKTVIWGTVPLYPTIPCMKIRSSI